MKDHGVIHFTLVELLIVIAIVAILSSMLLPALNKAKYVANLSVCSNNQKQLYLGMSQYDSDYNSLPPLYTDLSGCQPKWDVVSWNGMGMLYQAGYVAVGHTFYCPDPQNMMKKPADRFGQCSYNGKKNGVYGWEYAMKNDHWLMNNYWFRWCEVSQKKEQSEAGLTAMKSQLSFNRPNEWLQCDTWGRWISSDSSTYWNPHRNGTNVLYIDGHVSFLKATMTDFIAYYPHGLIPRKLGQYGN